MFLNNTSSPSSALVTGGAKRIGAAIVQALHAAGFNVLIHCHRSAASAQRLCQTLNQQRPDSAQVVICDLSQSDAADYIMNQLGAWQNTLKVLVNNASCFWHSALKSVDFQAQLTYYQVNVLTPLSLSIQARPFLAAQQGSIINITDIHASKPLKGYLEYCQTKAALLMQTKALAREFAPAVRVNAVAPGAIAWPEEDNALSPEAKQSIIEQTPLKKHGQPVYIAQAVLALIENEFITGQVLAVDGGRS